MADNTVEPPDPRDEAAIASAISLSVEFHHEKSGWRCVFPDRRRSTGIFQRKATAAHFILSRLGYRINKRGKLVRLPWNH